MQKWLSHVCFTVGATLTSGLVIQIRDHLPVKFKRIVYMSSILGLFTSKEPDAKLVEKMNNVLKLARNPEAYYWSIKVNSIIWKDTRAIIVDDHVLQLTKEAFDQMDEEDCWSIGHALANQCPNWIRYASEHTMATDATSVLLQLREYTAA